MKQLPTNVISYKRTREFDEKSVPLALLKDHQTKAGVWGKIIVLEGCLSYSVKSFPPETILIKEGEFGVVEPTVLHFVKPEGKVRFYVEFFV